MYESRTLGVQKIELGATHAIRLTSFNIFQYVRSSTNFVLGLKLNTVNSLQDGHRRDRIQHSVRLREVSSL